MNAPDVLSHFLSHAETLFPAVARASLLGGCAIALVIAFRIFWGRRLTPSFRLRLWLPAMALLLLPRLPDLGFKAPVAAPAAVVSNKSDAVAAVDISVPAAAVDSFANLAAPSAPSAPVRILETPPAPPSLAWSQVAALAWVMVMLVLALGSVFAHFAWRRRVFRASHMPSRTLLDVFANCCRVLGLRRAPRLMVSRALDNPVVTGLARARVIIPCDLESALAPVEVRHVLLHEAAHVRRGDLWWHWAWFAVLALHWFNPLVWLALRFARADREAACDATALAVLPGDARHAYGTTLLRIQERLAQCAAPRFVPGTVGGADLLRERILDISHHGRRSPRAGIVALVVTLLGASLIAVLAAEPPKAIPSAETPPPPTLVERGTVPAGMTACKIRIEFVKPNLDDGEKLVEQYIREQLDRLQSPAMRSQTEQRAKTLRPIVEPVPVTVTVERVPDALQIDMTATGSSDPYVRRYLAIMIAALAESRKEGSASVLLQTVEGAGTYQQRLDRVVEATKNAKEVTDQATKLKALQDVSHGWKELSRISSTKTEIARMQSWSYQWIEPITSTAATASPQAGTLTDDLVVIVNKDGKPSMGGEPLSEEALLESLKIHGSIRKDQRIVIRPAREFSHKDVVAVLHICQKAGIWNVSFAGDDTSGSTDDWWVSRAVVDVGPSPEDQGGKAQDEFIGKQVGMLQGGGLGQEVAARMKEKHPDLTPVRVTLSCERVPGTNHLILTATATSGPYVKAYLDALLEKAPAYLAEAKRGSLMLPLGQLHVDLMRFERRVKDMEAKLAAEGERDALNEALTKLRAETEKARQKYEAWGEKVGAVERSGFYWQPKHELKIVEPASPAKPEGLPQR